MIESVGDEERQIHEPAGEAMRIGLSPRGKSVFERIGLVLFVGPRELVGGAELDRIGAWAIVFAAFSWALMLPALRGVLKVRYLAANDNYMPE